MKKSLKNREKNIENSLTQKKTKFIKTKSRNICTNSLNSHRKIIYKSVNNREKSSNIRKRIVKTSSKTRLKIVKQIIEASLTNKEGLKAARWIKSGKIFLYAADQDYGQNVSEMVPFFGHHAATVTFPALFSKKTTKIIFADVSNVKGTYEIELKELHSSENEYEFLKRMNDLYQEFILKEPEGYLWMHRRFKSGLEENIYPKWSRRDKKRKKRRLKR